MLHLCTVHGKMYLYTYMPNAFHAKKRVFVYHWGEVCVCCANQSVVTPVLYVPKVLPTSRSAQEGRPCEHAFQVKQKAPVQHRHFLKTKQNEIHRSREVGRNVKTAPSCTPLCHRYNYNLRLYIKNQFVCYTASHSHTSSRSDYTQQGRKNRGVPLGKR